MRRQAILTARYVAKKKGLPLPELPPLPPCIYRGTCVTCGVEVIRKKADGRTDRCNRCRKIELSVVEHANRRAKRARNPKVYSGVCKTCKAIVTRKKSDGRIDRCDVCRDRQLKKDGYDTEKQRLLSLEWSTKNRVKSNEIKQRWVKLNREKRRKAANDWHKNNRAASVAAFARYRARKLKREPPWADRAAIAAFYQIARRAAPVSVLRWIMCYR
jgi:hypothetical protein